ncbi:MAG: glycosyltransferase, partial [Deltaproteobacteria bacterium]|nr:glycosyltransferase [Deltaproteobacteria bacterium]
MILTTVINVHKEGLWARKAIRSAYAALEKFPPGEAEIVVVADRADEATLQVVKEATQPHSPVPLSVVPVDVGDLGRARNHGVMAARGRFVAFLDGDDVWGEDWPTLGAAQLAKECDALGCEEAVAHPFLNVDFGDNSFWWTQPDQRDDGPGGFDMSTFWNTNCWSSGAMAPRSLLQQHPYSSRTEGLGFEDWEWNARTLAAGVLHVAVPRAVVFIRKKNDGLNAQSAQKRQLAAHSPYFENRPEVWPRHKAAPYDREALRVDEAWLLPQWRAAHRIEPALWPDARNMRGLPRYRAVPAPNVASVALAIADKLQAPPTHLILAPCLVKGGADKRVVAYAEAVVRAGGKPLVLLTDREDDPSWTSNLPEGVHAINVATMLKGAGNDAGILGLARLTMRFRPVVHVVNSRTGYGLLA